MQCGFERGEVNTAV